MEENNKPANIWNEIARRALRTGAHVPVVEEEFDREKALAGLAWNFAFNRRRKPAVISVFSNLMKTGTFASGSTIRIARSANGEWVLVDGQHRLMAIAEANVNIWMMVVIDERQDAVAYSKIDNVGTLRTFGDALSSIVGWSTEGNWKSVVGAVRIISGGFSRVEFSNGNKLRSLKHDESARLLIELREDIERISAICSKAKQSQAIRSPQLSVFLVAAKYNSDIFYPWFERAVKDDMLQKESTEKRLVETFSWSAQNQIDRYRLSMTTALIWNAQIRNEHMSAIPRVWLTGDRAITKWPGVLGTPFGPEK